MNDVVIKVENLSKQYRLGQVGTGTLAHDLNRWWHRIRGKDDPFGLVGQTNVLSTRAEGGKVKAETPEPEEPPLSTSAFSFPPSSLQSPSQYVWALKDINFEVRRGEVLGIIGANGAGKSTLLKILSRVTAPSQGRVKIKGRVGSLLEVGVGFHPELTGRENVYLNGAIMGMRKAEVAGKFDQIVEFSGCARYIDTPVKRYSSGMRVRLGFAVAAHLEPEILIVDEVLAVGDAEFQKKCLGKMKDVAGEGRTVLFVSHNMGAVQTLCTRAIRLEAGRLADTGDVRKVVDAYLNHDSEDVLHQEWESPEQAPGNDRVRVAFLDLDYPGKGDGRPIYTTTPIAVRYRFWNLVDGQRLNISSHLRTPAGEEVFNVWSEKTELPKGLIEGVLELPGDFLNDGLFSLDLMLVSNGRAIFQMDKAFRFHVHDAREGAEWFGRVRGAIRPAFLTFPLRRVDGE